jgi:hypothetical protein
MPLPHRLLHAARARILVLVGGAIHAPALLMHVTPITLAFKSFLTRIQTAHNGVLAALASIAAGMNIFRFPTE